MADARLRVQIEARNEASPVLKDVGKAASSAGSSLSAFGAKAKAAMSSVRTSALAAAGAVKVADDGTHRTYRVPGSAPAPSPGAPLRIVGMRATDNPQDAWWAFDGAADTGWGVFPQKPDQWVVADLGEPHEVGGLTHSIGDFQMDFPRQLAIDTSLDGEHWDAAWLGPTYAQTFTAFVRSPRVADLRFTFAPRSARYVRLRQLETFERIWRLSELTIHAP